MSIHDVIKDQAARQVVLYIRAPRFPQCGFSAMLQHSAGVWCRNFYTGSARGSRYPAGDQGVANCPRSAVYVNGEFVGGSTS